MTIYINPSHSAFSPGGCFGDRREYDDNCSLAHAVIEEFERLLPKAEILLLQGDSRLEEISSDSFLLVLHRAVPSRGEKQKGAFITVAEDADADIQYKASRLLECITGEDGFRYLGVHTLTKSSPFRRFGTLAARHRFLLSAGAIDSPEDNGVFEKRKSVFAENLAAAIVEICKEAENENNTEI